MDYFVSSILGVNNMHSFIYEKIITTLSKIYASSLIKVLQLRSNTIVCGQDTTIQYGLTVSDQTSVVKTRNEDGSKINLSVSDVNMVMNSLGMCNQFDENEMKFFEKGNFEGLFVEEEPCLEEIWEVFKVFDVNNDGFIDANELGRVLCKLGFLKEGTYIVERCKKMIRDYDRNDDGLLDFSDFLKFMQTCLC